MTRYPANLFVPDKTRTACPIWAVTRDELAEWCAAHHGAFANWVETSNFNADAGALLRLPDAGGRLDGVLLGLGAPSAAYPPDPLALAALPPALPEGQYRLDTACPHPIKTHAALAWSLGAYRFTAYRGTKIDDESWPQLIVPKGFDVVRQNAIAAAIYWARDLINTPAEDMQPSDLAAAAQALATEFDAEYAVTIGDDLLAQDYPLIHAVGRAAADAPRMIDLRWGAAEHAKITLIGKGVTFDTGGLNLKPAGAMGLMKKDMGGAAIALGLARAIMAQGLPVRLRVLIGAVENAIGAGAFRPGDILPSRKGLRVEIGNTDAEGRLVLADLLTEAAAETPDFMVDFATLTGAARVALGPQVTPFYTRHDMLADALTAGGQASADPMWRLPLWPFYDDWLDSRVADVNHISASPMAGSITAALFLARFVPQSQPWVHCDVYGWNAKTLPGRPEGGEAQALRATLELIERRFAAPDTQ